jgi:hypothetical protein
MYSSRPFFCGVWYPTRLGSAGSDTQQDLVLRGLIPCRILFCGVSDLTGKLRPRRIWRKSFESLPFSLKGHFSKIVCMYKLHYPRLIVSMLKEPPILKKFFFSAGYDIPRNHFRIWVSGEFEMEIKNILGHELGAHMRLIHGKKQRPKISCYCTFKLSYFLTTKSNVLLLSLVKKIYCPNLLPSKLS